MAEPATPIPTDLATRGDINSVLLALDHIRQDLRVLQADVVDLKGDMRSAQTMLRVLMGITGAIGTMLLYVVGNLLVRLIPPH